MGRMSWIVVFMLMLAPQAHAASFDCAKADTDVEKTICGDDKLSQLDSALAVAYKDALAATSNKQTLIHEQRKWIHDVRDACADVTCLTQAYSVRLREVPEPPDLRAALARHDNQQRERQKRDYGAILQKIDPSGYQFKYALVDLDGDGIQDAVVYFNDRESCGTGGCAMRVMKGTKDGFTYVSGTLRVFPPIQVLPSSAHGWRSLAIALRAGGTGVLKFDGKHYPLSPLDDHPASGSELQGAETLIPR